MSLGSRLLALESVSDSTFEIPDEIIEERKSMWSNFFSKYENVEEDDDVGYSLDQIEQQAKLAPAVASKDHLKRSARYREYLENQSDLALEVATQYGNIDPNTDEEDLDDDEEDLDDDEEEESESSEDDVLISKENSEEASEGLEEKVYQKQDTEQTVIAEKLISQGFQSKIREPFSMLPSVDENTLLGRRIERKASNDSTSSSPRSKLISSKGLTVPDNILRLQEYDTEDKENLSEDIQDSCFDPLRLDLDYEEEDFYFNSSNTALFKKREMPAVSNDDIPERNSSRKQSRDERKIFVYSTSPEKERKSSNDSTSSSPMSKLISPKRSTNPNTSSYKKTELSTVPEDPAFKTSQSQKMVTSFRITNERSPTKRRISPDSFSPGKERKTSHDSTSSSPMSRMISPKRCPNLSPSSCKSRERSVFSKQAGIFSSKKPSGNEMIVPVDPFSPGKERLPSYESTSSSPMSRMKSPKWSSNQSPSSGKKREMSVFSKDSVLKPGTFSYKKPYRNESRILANSSSPGNERRSSNDSNSSSPTSRLISPKLSTNSKHTIHEEVEMPAVPEESGIRASSYYFGNFSGKLVGPSNEISADSVSTGKERKASNDSTSSSPMSKMISPKKFVFSLKKKPRESVTEEKENSIRNAVENTSVPVHLDQSSDEEDFYFYSASPASCKKRDTVSPNSQSRMNRKKHHPYRQDSPRKLCKPMSQVSLHSPARNKLAAPQDSPRNSSQSPEPKSSRMSPQEEKSGTSSVSEYRKCDRCERSSIYPVTLTFEHCSENTDFFCDKCLNDSKHKDCECSDCTSVLTSLLWRWIQLDAHITSGTSF